LALFEQQQPTPTGWSANDKVVAFSAIEGSKPRPIDAGVAMPASDARLRPNPLMENGRVRWPSERYATEYAHGCFWTMDDDELPRGFSRDPARLRRVVDLPDRW
jgi:hypothetical protein